MQIKLIDNYLIITVKGIDMFGGGIEFSRQYQHYFAKLEL